MLVCGRAVIYGSEQKKLTFCNRNYNCNYDRNEDFTTKLQIEITKILRVHVIFTVLRKA